jgi:hypothetical protein
MVRLRSGNAPTPAKPAATGRPILREKTNTTTGTPAPAVETSMLALKNFKRRPRQGSMLEMVRKRRSSVQASLISARPQQDDDVEDTSVFDLGSASEGEDVFAPEAEGTPLQTSKTRKSTSTRKSVSARKSVAATTPAVKKTKRKSDDLESPLSALDALRAKHRKSEAPPVEDEPLPSIDDDEQQPMVHDTSDHEASPVPNPVTSDVQVINSSPDSTPPTEPSSTRKIPGTEEADFAVPSTEEQERLHTSQQDGSEDERQEVEDDEEAEDEDDLDTPNATMAEPASSSPNGSPIPDTQRTDIYADPLTQLSPPPPEPAKTRSKGNSKKPTAMSTATLRALLPKRTQRPQPRPKRTEYDISSDEEDDAIAFDTTHLEDDEDELGGRTRRQTRAAAPSKGGRKSTAATSTSKSKSTTSTRKPSAPPPPPAKTKSKSKAKAKSTTTRTYGRATTTSDKENEGGDGGQESSSENGEQAETSMSMREVAHSKELEEARRKFAEVDNWDLAFESVSNEGHRSSSQGWR